jgi:hypothetical protein
VVLEGEGSADWMMIAEAIDEYALVAEMSEVEAIELDLWLRQDAALAGNYGERAFSKS